MLEPVGPQSAQSTDRDQLDAAPYPRPIVAWFVIGVLVTASLVSFVDRQVVAIVVEPMKSDLGVGDAQIGWLYGIFAVFHALAGLPIAYLADRKRRTRIIAAGVFVWSVMTMLCGLSRTFWQVLLARMGVGVGEATLGPATISLVGDYFPRPTIPLALSVFQTGAIMGSGLAFIIGGVVLGVVQDAPPLQLPVVGPLGAWQQTFLYVGAPGILLAILLLGLREPVRRHWLPAQREPHGKSRVAPAASGDQSDLKASLRALLGHYRQHRWTLLWHHLGFLSFALLGYAFVFWTVSYFTRVHGMQAAEASRLFGFIFLIAGPLGAIWAGLQARWFAARGRRDACIVVGMIGGGVTMIVILLIQLMPNPTGAFLLYIPAMFFVNSPFGIANGALPVMTPPSMRAQVGAVYMFVSSMGMLLGPPIAGIFNERIFPGGDGVRYSIASVTLLFGCLGLLFLWLGRKPYARSLAEMELQAQG